MFGIQTSLFLTLSLISIKCHPRIFRHQHSGEDSSRPGIPDDCTKGFVELGTLTSLSQYLFECLMYVSNNLNLYKSHQVS